MGEGYGNFFGDGINWDAVPHRQLYDWFTQVPTDSLSASVQAWMDNVGSRFQAAADKVTESLRAAGVHWEGAAAESMRESSAPLAAHALAAKDAATSVGQTTVGQVFTITEIEHAMPEPVPAPEQKDLLSMVGSPALVQHLVDVHEQERAAAEAEARARDLARNYDARTDEAIGGLPRFDVAPRATVAKTEPGDTIAVPDPRPGGPGPGDEPRGGDSGPGPGDVPRGTGSAQDGPSSPVPVNPQDGGGGVDVRPGATSGQSWTAQPTGPGGNPGNAPQPGPGPADTARPTGAHPGLVSPGTPGGVSSGGPRGGVPGSGRLGRSPGGAAPGERVGAGGRALAGEGAVARGGAATAGRGAGMGMAPVGAGRGQGDEDKERTGPEYLRDYHDEFWDDTPPVAPAVIGEDDDED